VQRRLRADFCSRRRLLSLARSAYAAPQERHAVHLRPRALFFVQFRRERPRYPHATDGSRRSYH
jgi:hypothetical protein